jgi:hypothetical protein
MRTARRLVHLVPAFTGLLVAACAGYEVQPAPPLTQPAPAGAAKVCIVRIGSDGALSTFPVRDNGVLVGATVGGSCFCYFAAEGRHELEARSDGYDTIEIEVKRGADVYLVQAARGAVGIVRAPLSVLTADEGKAAMKTCQYSVLTQVPDGTYQTKPGTVIVAR